MPTPPPRVRTCRPRLHRAAPPALLAALLAAALCACPPAQGATVTLTPVTITTPNFGGPIVITGTVTMGPGEVMLNPTVQSSHAMPFLSSYTAGFNGPGQQFDPAFLAWNGLGTYSGPILNHQISPGNLGYSGGMPLGLYGSNVLGPGGGSGIVLYFVSTSGSVDPMSATFAIQVVPAPGAAAALGLAACLAGRRRR